MKSKTIIKAAVITISDSCAAGRRCDESGEYLKKRLRQTGWQVVFYRIIPDEEKEIVRLLKQLSDKEKFDIVFTSGGTGLAKRDVTPEATRKVIEKEVPGLSEVIRLQNFQRSPFSILSRAVCGTRKKTLIINLPGSLRGVRETIDVILPVLKHAVDVIQGRTQHGENK